MIDDHVARSKDFSNFLYKTAQKEVVSSNSLLHHAEEEEDLKSDVWQDEKQEQDNEAMKQIVTTQVNGGRSRNSPS